MDNKKFCHITTKIDNKAPHFPVFKYLKGYKLLSDVARIRDIDKENMKLLKRMNYIHRIKGELDPWAPDIVYKTKFKDQDYQNNIIMQENKRMLKRLHQTKTQYSIQKFKKEWKTAYELVQHRSRSVSMIKKLAILEAQKRLIGKKRCFFDVGLKEENYIFGRIVFEMYETVVPRTCENFIALCRGTNGLSYKNTPFHRIVSGYWCQGGDVTKFDGSGGTSALYGESFEKENFKMSHTGPGILSMCNNDEDRNDSKFNLTFTDLRTADGNKVVFGRVIDGMMNLYKIQEFGTKFGKPIKSVIVLNCGILPEKKCEDLSKKET